MACYRPLKAYKKHGGGLAWSSKEGFADRPVEIACGQCRTCRMQRARWWALRICHEALMHDRNCFITVTYRDAPRSLNVEDWKAFAKRLRHSKGPFRFFHCGEYGDLGGRPHYHACIFGLDFHEDREFFKGTKYGPLYSSESLSKAWKHGFCSIGALTYESAEYVSRYVLKKRTGPEGLAAYSDWTGHSQSLQPPYVTMSRRPGIGSTWFEKYAGDVYPHDEVIHDGRKFRPPRFYDDRLSDVDNDLLANIKSKRADAVFLRKEELTPERLKVREKVDLARDAFYEREL